MNFWELFGKFMLFILIFGCSYLIGLYVYNLVQSYKLEHEHKEAALDHITAQLRLIDDRNRNLEKRIIKLESEFRNDL